MILDTSAIVAQFLSEPGSKVIEAKLEVAKSIAIGAPTLTELGVVLWSKFRQNPMPRIARFQEMYRVTVVPFSDAHWREAVSAFERFGRGRHPAGLNFGDCFSYATAKLSNRPLLCVGNDFSKTDLLIA